jgi:GNAT superfamily N-acetyltransferase
MFHFDYILAGESHIPVLIDCRIQFLKDLPGPQTEAAEAVLRQSLRTYFRQALNNKTYICWIAQHNGEVAGIGGMAVRTNPGSFKNPSGKAGYIMNMYTVPSYRRNGICANILNRLVATGKDLGIQSFELHATKEGEPVYQQNGFKLHPEPTYRM